MNHTINKETLPVVIQEIENILADYPEYPYQAAFAIHELRQKLIAHVFNYVPNYSTIIADTPLLKDSMVYSSLKRRLHLETLIRGSILHLLRENADWVSRHISQDSVINSY